VGGDLALLGAGQPPVDEDQDWEHHQGRDGGPLQQEADHDEEEAVVLRVPDSRVRTGRREAVVLCGFVEHLPRGGDQPESAADERVAGQVERAQVRVAGPADQVIPQMPTRSAGNTEPSQPESRYTVSGTP